MHMPTPSDSRKKFIFKRFQESQHLQTRARNLFLNVFKRVFDKVKKEQNPESVVPSLSSEECVVSLPIIGTSLFLVLYFSILSMVLFQAIRLCVRYKNLR